MTPNKPVTENMKAKVTALYEYLKTQDDFVTKEQIGTQLCIYNERTIRV